MQRSLPLLFLVFGSCPEFSSIGRNIAPALRAQPEHFVIIYRPVAPDGARCRGATGDI